VLDVRSTAELDGELGHLAGVQSIPLAELRARVAEVPTERPIIVVCQTGKRSGMGTVMLRAAGVARCANLAGGMARWRELGLPS
jgi:rhodanese-related sulfurtransferase